MKGYATTRPRRRCLDMDDEKSNPLPESSARRRRFNLIAGLVLLVPLGFSVYLLWNTVSRDMAQRSCHNHLKQLSYAILEYEFKHGSLPPAFVNGKDGKPAHSWRVLILPYLGHQDLFDAYHFDEPWDGPNNIKLVEKMPDVFACPGRSNRPKGKTDYVAVVGSQTAWPGSRSRRLQSIADGTSNTLQLTELANSDITWTEPRDLRIGDLTPPDADGIGPAFDSHHEKVVNVTFCDGSAHALQKTLARRTLHALLTAARGQPFMGEWLPGENPAMQMEDFPAEQDASALTATDVLPHALAPIQAARNYIYCATFQIAWERGIDLRTIRREVEKLIRNDPEMVTIPQLPQTLLAMQVIQYAREAAEDLNNEQVGTEHLLLGLLRVEGGVASQVLQKLGLEIDAGRIEMKDIG